MREAEVDLSRVAWRTSSYSGNGSNCVEVGVWRTSSYSGNGSDCVEVGAWAKSSHSNGANGCVEVGAWTTSSHTGNGADCVEGAAVGGAEQAASGGVADVGRVILVRDSKDRDGGVLAVDEDEWRAFIAGIKDGDFSPA